MGGIAGLALLLLLIAFLTRRYRRKVDERREKRKVGRPMLSPQDTYDGFHHNPNVTTVTAGLHQRSGSTANDVYMSAGGAYYMPQQHSHTRQRSIYQDG